MELRSLNGGIFSTHILDMSGNQTETIQIISLEHRFFQFNNEVERTALDLKITKNGHLYFKYKSVLKLSHLSYINRTNYIQIFTENLPPHTLVTCIRMLSLASMHQ